MMRAAAIKAFTAGALVLYCGGFASAHVQHWRRHARYVHTQYVYRPARVYGDAIMSKPAHPYQAYAGNGGLGYGGVPENPLLPIRAEVPPPVDPNEPASGSYGAMLEGRNPAPSEP